jgi:hypothetical protein
MGSSRSWRPCPRRWKAQEEVKLRRMVRSVCGMIRLSGSLPERKRRPREAVLAARRQARRRRRLSEGRPHRIARLRREGCVRAVALHASFQG